MRRDVFQAIADPTRRNILTLIATTPMNVNTIAENFKMSRPAVSQHVKILEECGLVEIRTVGRERHCHAALNSLAAVHTWLHLVQGTAPVPTPKVRAARTTTATPVKNEESAVEAVISHALDQTKEKKNKKQDKKNKKKKAKKEGKKGKKEKKG